MLESIANYFETIPSLHRSLILVGGIAFFWTLESANPLFQFNYKKWQHAKVNIFFTVTTIIVNFVMAGILLISADYVVQHKLGLLQWLALPIWGQLIVGLLLLDLISAYFIHFLEHKVKWMWQFHLIHHTDQQVDTTSANRHHPGESVFRFFFTLIAVIFVGSPIWIVMLYQSLSVVLSQFNHSNIRMPQALDNILSWVIVTPNIHRVHHHYQQPYTDSNYGNIFSFWDRMFGTLKHKNNRELVFGLDTHFQKSEAENIKTMLRLPFTPYRSPK